MTPRIKDNIKSRAGIRELRLAIRTFLEAEAIRQKEYINAGKELPPFYGERVTFQQIQEALEFLDKNEPKKKLISTKLGRAIRTRAFYSDLLTCIHHTVWFDTHDVSEEYMDFEGLKKVIGDHVRIMIKTIPRGKTFDPAGIARMANSAAKRRAVLAEFVKHGYSIGEHLSFHEFDSNAAR